MTYEIKNVIVQHYAGSIAYGTSLPTSDVDIRGVFCTEEKYIRTPFFNMKEVNLVDEEDGKLYELTNYLQLYTDCNPNIIESLWVEPSDIISSSDAYEYLVQHREALLCSKVAFKYSGYAHAQLKRIKGHDKWLTNPQPEQGPTHKQHVKMVQNFTEGKIMARDFDIEKVKDMGLVHYGNDIFGIVDDVNKPNVLTKEGEFNLKAAQSGEETCIGVLYEQRKHPYFLVKYNEASYKAAKLNHKNYWEWKNNRNEARSELEAKHGYDTKHAMHLVRLMRTAEEILTGQGVIVKRPDAKELLEIRNGAMTYDEIVEYAEAKDKYIIEELYPKTALRKKPDIKLAAKVLMDVQDMYWKT